jgi:hypothetical protein
VANTIEKIKDAMKNDREFLVIVDAHSDEKGLIIPMDSSLDSVRREYPNHSPRETWRLAQAQTLIDLYASLTAEREARRD